MRVERSNKKNRYHGRVYLSKLLYLQRISDNRILDSPLMDQEVFERLCGKGSLYNVTFVTTMWDEIDPSRHEAGDDREIALKTGVFGGMINEGAQVARFYGTHESAWSILSNLSIAASRPVPLRDTLSLTIVTLQPISELAAKVPFAPLKLAVDLLVAIAKALRVASSFGLSS